MRPLKLHTKTTLLASGVTVLVIAALLWLVSVRVADFVREEQRARAEAQAENFAEHISNLPEAERAPEALARAATLVRSARPAIVAVRVWERSGGLFSEQATAAGSPPAAEIPDETRAALRSGVGSRTVSARPANTDDSLYRVFAPITERGGGAGDRDSRVSGAVEIIERLDDAPTVAVRLERTALWLALAAVITITLATFAMFRRIVYRPVESLLDAMRQAEAGDLRATALVRADDELGRLAGGFNRMIGRIAEMTDERLAQQRILEERVREATRELAERNEDLRETNLELWRTTQKLAELERFAAAGQTAAQFAHEVGTPLNLVSGHVQLLQANLDGNERALTRLQTIRTQIERIERIVRTMLDRTRPQAVELVPIDLHGLVHRLFESIAPLLDARGVILRHEVPADLPPVAGDADHLQQVFINLVNNALDAMPHGGKLRISATVVDYENVVVEFADTGAGMTPDVQARIFDPLYTTKRRGRGTGLGLVIIQQVMREHGGEITVESEAGRGTTFRLTFKVAAGAVAESAGSGAALEQAATRAETKNIAGGKSGKANQ